MAASDSGGMPYVNGSKGYGSRKPPHFEGVISPFIAAGS
jgi:hypothetical protein